MSAADVAVDTNILIYVYSEDRRKRSIAIEPIEAGCLVSVQALNEFASVAVRKLRFSWDETEEALDAIIAQSTVSPIEIEHHFAARRIAKATRYSFYDSLMIAVALEGGARTFLSEDLQDGRVVEGMTIRNPFV
ncbi:MAG: PIN domain-containing protein [Pseudomonadota bacterium]